jgi:pyruvate,water dikinase
VASIVDFGKTIVSPTDFPVVWDDPANAKLHWRLDGHVTTAKAPLSGSVSTAVLRGFSQAFAQLGLGIQMRTAVINGYGYSTIVPTTMPPPLVRQMMSVLNRAVPSLARWIMSRQQAAISQKQLATIQPILARFDAYWCDELLPLNQAQLAFFEEASLSAISLPQLRAHLGEALQQAETMGKLHALAAFPAMVAMSLFEEFFIEQFPTATPLEALRLLQGFDNQTLCGDRALWQLSRMALAQPAVKVILEREEPVAALTALSQSPEACCFLDALQAYLQKYGRRLNVFAQLTEPSWLEEPVTAVACLQTYLSQQDSNPEAVQARLVAERDQAIAEARRTLAERSPTVQARFTSLLAAAQRAAGVKEDNHWIIQALFYEMRRLALALGQRLCETGALAAAEDVFYLTAEELTTETGLSLAQINERKAARVHFSQVMPPTQLGTLSTMPPPDTPFFRAIQKADVAEPKSSASVAQRVQGQAAAVGVRRGRARIIHTLADAGKLQPGEVLITKATTPPWTPLFGVATAVVTDTGGILSHCAVVAREYGIPAVVGTGQATQIFRDGQLLEVNGTVGTVCLLSGHES